MAALASLVAALITLLPGVPYVAEWSSQGWRWDALWRDGFIKQVTGFSLAGLAVAGLVLSLRKRIARLAFGHFALWRNLHVALGLAAVGALLLACGHFQPSSAAAAPDIEEVIDTLLPPDADTGLEDQRREVFVEQRSRHLHRVRRREVCCRERQLGLWLLCRGTIRIGDR